MNSRIFKKLTKAASIEIDRLGLQCFGERFESNYDDEDSPEIKRIYNWEKKSLDRWRGKVTDSPKILQGTVGYGTMTGYYEPEWDDCDALSCLFDHVFELFTDWGNCDGGNYPENYCPAILKTSARHLINYAKTLPITQ